MNDIIEFCIAEAKNIKSWEETIFSDNSVEIVFELIDGSSETFFYSV